MRGAGGGEWRGGAYKRGLISGNLRYTSWLRKTEEALGMWWNWWRRCRRGLGRGTSTGYSKWLIMHQTRERFDLPASRQFCRVYLCNLWTGWLWTPSLHGLTLHWNVHFHRSTLSFRYVSLVQSNREGSTVQALELCRLTKFHKLQLMSWYVKESIHVFVLNLSLTLHVHVQYKFTCMSRIIWL